MSHKITRLMFTATRHVQSARAVKIAAWMAYRVYADDDPMPDGYSPRMYFGGMAELAEVIGKDYYPNPQTDTESKTNHITQTAVSSGIKVLTDNGIIRCIRRPRNGCTAAYEVLPEISDQISEMDNGTTHF